MKLSSHKHITFFSNNFWTLYKFREDAINLFIKNGYKVNLIGKYDGFEQKFSDANINKSKEVAEACMAVGLENCELLKE